MLLFRKQTTPSTAKTVSAIDCSTRIRECSSTNLLSLQRGHAKNVQSYLMRAGRHRDTYRGRNSDRDKVRAKETETERERQRDRDRERRQRIIGAVGRKRDRHRHRQTNRHTHIHPLSHTGTDPDNSVRASLSVWMGRPVGMRVRVS